MATIEQTEFTTRSGKKLLIRAFTGDDGKVMNDFRRTISEESKNTLHYSGMELPGVKEASDFLKVQFEHPVNLGFGAFDGDRLIGSLGLSIAKHEHPWVKHIGIFGMATIKDCWGLGIGTKLLQVLDEYSKSIGLTRIEAMVRVKNKRGVNLYMRNGYEIEGTRRRAALIDGDYVDEYFIAKISNNPK